VTFHCAYFSDRMASGPGGRGRGGGGRGRGRGVPFGGRKPSGKRAGGRQQNGAGEPFGLDEVDAFHKQRDQVKLAVSDDERDSDADSDLDAAAYELSHSDESGESDSDEDGSGDEESEEEDEDAALQAAIQRGGRIGRRELPSRRQLVMACCATSWRQWQQRRRWRRPPCAMHRLICTPWRPTSQGCSQASSVVN